MSTAAKFAILPRPGRGLITSYNVHSIGEFIDAFPTYQHIFDGNNAWSSRSDDTTVASSATGSPVPVRALHFFNRVVDTAGGMATILLAAQGNNIYRLDTGALIFSGSSPYEFCFETVKNRCWIAGANNVPQIFDGTATVPWGADGPSTDMTYEPFNANDADTKVWVGTCNVTKGSTTVTKASGSNYTTGGAWDGKTTLIDGVEYVIASVTDTTHLLLTEQFKGDTATGLAQHVHYGGMSWETQPPIYAFAYYNPTTGHVTNRSPLLMVSEQRMHNVRVSIGNIVTNSTLNGYGYTKIILFRNADGGGVLFDLALLNNTGGPLTYLDEGASSALGSVVGLKRAPVLNNKPPTGLRFITYFRGRFFAVDGATPYRLIYSGDSGQIELGVPEECWPATNFRDMPAPITGFRVVGDTLLICTERFIYYLVGSTETDFDYRRLSARGVGVRHWAIDEHPGDTSQESSSAIYIGRDKRVWRHYAGGRLDNIGDPIQDVLDAAPIDHSRPFFLKVCDFQRYRYLVLGIINAGKTAYSIRFFDFDANKWVDHGFTSAAHYSVTCDIDYSNGHKFRTLIGSSSASQYVAFAEAGGYKDATMKSFPLDFGDRNAKKTLDSLTAYVNNIGLNWTLTVDLDESGSEITLQKMSVSGTPRDRGPGVIKWSARQSSGEAIAAQWHALAFRLNIPAGGKAYKAEAFFTPESTWTGPRSN